MVEELSKLQIGVQAYYDGSFEDDNGEFIESKLIQSGLTLDEFQLCKEWIYAYNTYHENDYVRYGCDCGCGGDSLDIEAEEEKEDDALEKMRDIELKLGTPPAYNKDDE